MAQYVMVKIGGAAKEGCVLLRQPEIASCWPAAYLFRFVSGSEYGKYSNHFDPATLLSSIADVARRYDFIQSGTKG